MTEYMAHYQRTAIKWRKTIKRVIKLTRSPRFALFYCVAAIGILAVTTIYWSILGSLVQSSNADQLANTLLLEKSKTIAGALLPSQHSFLLKIPLFWIVSIYGSSPMVFTIATVFLSLLTVGGLVYIIWRIESRPLVFGTIVLALAAVLLYIPAQSYPGSLLPANFAMLTTRNIEYILFVGALILLLKARRIRSLLFILGCAGMILLLSSDRIFISLGLATAVISGILFLIVRRTDCLWISIRVLFGMVIAYLGASVALFLLTCCGVHFDSGSALGPYGFVRSPKDFFIAIVYGILSILTNFGANPAFSALSIRDIPAHIVAGFLSPSGIGYVITICIAYVAIHAIVVASVRVLDIPNSSRKVTLDWQTILPVMLFATSIGAFLVYILSNHYYPADSRYLAIVLFAGFIAIASVYRKSRLKPHFLVKLGLLAFIAIVSGCIFQLQNLSAQNKVMGEIEHRNTIVAAALKSHPVSTLLGNYWRVLPIKLGSPTLNVMPLEGCTTPRQVLSSTAWQPDLKKTRFAYILRLDGSLANFPSCSLQQVTDTYGRPDSSIVIAGTRSQPKELLLFFNEGIHIIKDPTENDPAADTVKPMSINTMPFTTCPSTTIMQFVAHEDDDILFMNPDLTHAIKSGECIRTIYVTAGDAGRNQSYWLSRQHGIEAAYNTILGTPVIPWTERIVALDAGHTITIANPRGNHAVSLIFLHLPDGNPSGNGFTHNHYESLQKLYLSQIPAIHTVDNNELYTKSDIISALTHLMEVYTPTQIRTLSTYSGSKTKDHSDHNAVGEFTTLSYKSYSQSISVAPLIYYLGYPVHDLPANVEGEDYSQKVAAFLSFGQFDPATCSSIAICNNKSVYGIYLSRQYTYPY